MTIDTALGPVNVTTELPDGTKFYQIEATWPPAHTLIRSDQIFGTVDRLKECLPLFLNLIANLGYDPKSAQLRAVELDYVR